MCRRHVCKLFSAVQGFFTTQGGPESKAAGRGFVETSPRAAPRTPATLAIPQQAYEVGATLFHRNRRKLRLQEALNGRVRPQAGGGREWLHTQTWLPLTLKLSLGSPPPAPRTPPSPLPYSDGLSLPALGDLTSCDLGSKVRLLPKAVNRGGTP